MELRQWGIIVRFILAQNAIKRAAYRTCYRRRFTNRPGPTDGTKAHTGRESNIDMLRTTLDDPTSNSCIGYNKVRPDT